MPMTEAHATDPINPYGSSKLACERMLQDFAGAYGLRSIAFRYFNAAGADPDGEIGEDHVPETHLIPLVLEAAAGSRPFVSVFGNAYPTRDGTCLRDYVHVCDLAQAHVLGLQRLQSSEGAAVFNLGNGEGFTVLEVVEAARRVTGAPIPLRIEPPRPGDPPSLLADSRRAREELGWRPDYPEIEVQLRHAWNWRMQDESRAVPGI
jgi:UDP-glucose-4-epimerase GalE